MLPKIMVPGIYYDNLCSILILANFLRSYLHTIFCFVWSSFLSSLTCWTAFKQFGDHFIDGEVLSDSGTFQGNCWSESLSLLLIFLTWLEATCLIFTSGCLILICCCFFYIACVIWVELFTCAFECVDCINLEV